MRLQPSTTYGVDERRGFLAADDPLVEFDVDGHDGELAGYLATLDELGAGLVDSLEDDELRPTVRSLEVPEVGWFADLDERELVRVCLVTGYLASAYVHKVGDDAVDRIPAGVAVPFYHASKRLGRPPILAYDLLCLHNFVRMDPDAGFAVENLETTQQFTRHDDERWFVAIHVAIEAAAGPALVAAPNAHRAVADDDQAALKHALATIADSLEEQTDLMRRMTEGNEPSVFAREYRPYFDGFGGVVFEGVTELGGQPQSLRGGSGAQSSVLPAIDAALGIDHEATVLVDHLREMREYMPDSHRSFVEALEAGPDVHAYVAGKTHADLQWEYNRCVSILQEFREVHLGQTLQYIRAVTGETSGTGGTPYMSFLEQMKEETAEHKL